MKRGKPAILFIFMSLTILTVVLASSQSDLTDRIKNTGSLGLMNKTGKVLATEVKIPETLNPIARIALGIDENLPFSSFVVNSMIN